MRPVRPGSTCTKRGGTVGSRPTISSSLRRGGAAAHAGGDGRPAEWRAVVLGEYERVAAEVEGKAETGSAEAGGA